MKQHTTWIHAPFYEIIDDALEIHHKWIFVETDLKLCYRAMRIQRIYVLAVDNALPTFAFTYMPLSTTSCGYLTQKVKVF